MKETTVEVVAHPNDFDQRRIERALKARKRYRYVTPSVVTVDGRLSHRKSVLLEKHRSRRRRGRRRALALRRRSSKTGGFTGGTTPSGPGGCTAATTD